jgi:integrase
LLTEERLNAFLRHLRQSRSPSTVKNYRGDLLVLWRWVADNDLAQYPRARRILHPQQPQTIPDCWSTAEVRTLLEAAERLPGELRNGVARSTYWQAAVRVGYESGLRRSDVWRVRQASLSSSGILVSVAHKTGQRTIHQLQPETVQLLRQIGTALPLSWPYDQRYFGVCFDRLVRDSGVRRGTFKWLRRSSGSYVEAGEPGAGPRHLGHSSPAVFARFYDARLAADAVRLPQPPTL